MPLAHFLQLCRPRSLTVLAAAALAAISLNLGDAQARSGEKPTIVLVHGAFADASASER